MGGNELRERAGTRVPQRVCLRYELLPRDVSPWGENICGWSAGRHPWSAAWLDVNSRL